MQCNSTVVKILCVYDTVLGVAAACKQVVVFLSVVDLVCCVMQCSVLCK